MTVANRIVPNERGKHHPVAIHHTPGTNRKRTRWAYSLYPGNSACNVWSSHCVRRTNTRNDSPAGMSAHTEPRDRAIPTAKKKPPT